MEAHLLLNRRGGLGAALRGRRPREIGIVSALPIRLKNVSHSRFSIYPLLPVTDGHSWQTQLCAESPQKTQVIPFSKVFPVLPFRVWLF